MNVLEKILEEIEDRKSYHEELLSQRDDYEIQKMYCDEELNWIRDIIRSHMVEKKNVTSAEIIRNFIDGKPYYSIKFKETGKDDYTIGYSSYNLAYVIEWLNECFEFCGKTKVASDNGGWIPVKERLPEDDDMRFYMCIAENHEEDLPMFCQYDREYGFGFWRDIYDSATLGFVDTEFSTNDELGYEKVVAWQPLPEPYKEE